jgi:transposase
MGASRRQYTDEFKREAVELLASSGQPLSQIAGEVGIPAARLRAWRNTAGRGPAGSPRRPNAQAAIPPGGTDLAAENSRLRRENERLIGGRPRLSLVRPARVLGAIRSMGTGISDLR